MQSDPALADRFQILKFAIVCNSASTCPAAVVIMKISPASVPGGSNEALYKEILKFDQSVRFFQSEHFMAEYFGIQRNGKYFCRIKIIFKEPVPSSNVVYY